jgi:glycosyltransferase involved in cell wall biosynthesis
MPEAQRMNVAEHSMIAEPDVSVVLPTYNRATSVLQALDSVLTQRTGHRYEVIVVDNNSTDDTRDRIDRVIAAGAGGVRYIVEGRQGVSNARNAGIAAARAPIVAFLDDDIRVESDWIETICRVFAAHPGIHCIGGKVLPLWEVAPPAWLSREHWAPVALLDFGDAPQILNARNRRCLLSANLACRRELFARVGCFRPELQRVKDSIGSMEDYEWLLRFWDADGEALYVPELRAWTEVPASRMTHAYHRRWHSGHGHYFALLNDPDFEVSTKPRVFGVPAHAYRAALVDCGQWLGRMLRGDSPGAFTSETRLRFFRSYLRTRRAASRSKALGSQPASSAH